MRVEAAMLAAILLSGAVMCGCGGGGAGTQPVTPVVTWATPAAIIYGTALGATQLNATASVSGTFAYTPAAGMVLAAGSQTLSVTFTPTDTTDYTTATAKVTLMVNPTAPAISTSTQNGAQNGAVIVSLSNTTPSALIYYTVDATTPTASSQQYQAPFLVASNLAVEATAIAGGNSSTVASQSFSANIPSNTLVWSDEFANTTGAPAQPDPTIWTYDTGNSGFGNNELETYCAWGSSTSPCSMTNPSEYVGTDGYLHIVAQQPSSGVYTSARLKTQGLFSFQYGRIEFRAQVPEAQGFWPANWLLGNNIATVNWPACGEMDVLERVNAATTPDWNAGSIHGTGFTGGTGLGMNYDFPSGQTAAQWHTYGMAWSQGKVMYYVDEIPYVTFTTASLSGLPGAVWPFDAGQANFIILNLAIGGSYPGPPDSTTPFPSEMLIDYVRIYAN
jgi:beta-glucanase (GH16 family)